MHGRVVEGTIMTTPLAVPPNPNLDLWVDSQFGRIGHHFRIRHIAVRAADDLYELVDGLKMKANWRFSPSIAPIQEIRKH